MAHAGKIQNELVSLMLEMTTLAERAIADATKALDDHDVELARQVIVRDAEIDALEERIEEICLEMLKDGCKGRKLRLVVSTFKSVTDLERIGDYSVALAQIALSVANKPVTGSVLDIIRMSELAVRMLKTCRDAYAGKRPLAVDSVFGMDAKIDILYNEVFLKTVSAILEEPRTVTNYVYMIMAGRAIERIGDHVTNVAERIEYVDTGRMARRSYPMHVPAAGGEA